ncbi:Gelsolin, partial [Trichostrongylus colubriformis]
MVLHHRFQDFKLEAVPKKEYGLFHSNDSYIVLNSTNSGWDVHFWLGETASQDETGTAAIKTVEIDQALHGLPVQYREVQNHESPLFLSYFPNGIRYLAGGYESGFHHVEDEFKNWKPRLFHCKGKRNIRCYQVNTECKIYSACYCDVVLCLKR